MKPVLTMPIAISASIAITLASTSTSAASLTGPVGGADAGAAGYTTANLPSYVSMYEYVPAKLAAHPPVLVVSHWYGATAAGMFGVAQGGGLVAAADQYGFIMVFPQRDIGGCWDISSTPSLTHDGGGETQAIAEMVKYEVAHRGANANRVYATGQSCGAMFTEALLAVYPDVFKGGSEFSGVPVGGCWTCSGGYVDHTPQQWGAIVDATYAGYSGYRPRVQLWHGDADTTVNYQNQIEAIKEWTDVLGLSLTPTSTTMLTFNGHMWTREMWQDACGFTLLDAFTEQGGPHNTDASEDATYVIPFLALDDTGPMDPQVSQACAADAGSSDAAAPGSNAGDASLGPEGSGVEPEEGGAPGSSSSGAGTGSSSSAGSSSDGRGSGDAGQSAGAASAPGSSASNGCSCRVLPRRGQTPIGVLAVAGFLVGILRHRRRQRLLPLVALALGTVAFADACSSSNSGGPTNRGTTGSGGSASSSGTSSGAASSSGSSEGSDGSTRSTSSGSSGSSSNSGSSSGADAGGGDLEASSTAESGPPPTGPCDLYGAGGTPCVAAFSTVRAMYGTYSGNLYQVRRADNNMTRNIGPLSQGGVANAAAQDSFCSGTTCTISIIFDQSGKANDLTKAPGGSATYGPNPDMEAVADALPVMIGGHKAYGVHVTPAPSWTSTGQVGYRNTSTQGTATGDDPETEYMVADGTYFNGSCCFDFGNSEMKAAAGGPGSMEAIYFGNCNWWDKGYQNGPWVMADLEVGVFNTTGQSGATNNNDLALAYPFATAMVKGNSAQSTSGGPFTIKGGNAQSGGLTTMWDGARPSGYSPMHKQGGIVLGVGGDNSSTAQGNFYEGVMTTGYASTATDEAVQANIVAAGYGH
jgi:poly(hydroxyalkanoate) depolymerase family esterase